MEPVSDAIVITSGAGGDGISGLALLLISVFFAMSTALVAGVFVSYLKNKATALRAISASAIASGAIMAAVGALGLTFDDPSWRPFLILPIAILAMVFWISMLIDCAIKEPREGNDKLVWVIIIVFTQLIGAGIYLFIRRPQRIAEMGS